jgi:diketogulonate reductase-like aldo/keto reductase
MNNTPLLTLNNKVRMPAIGLGVFRAAGDEASLAVQAAIASGYRLIDTASAYQNEDQVGRGIAASGVAREELFVITKLWLNEYGYDAALRAFDASLGRLGLDYVDLYLLHWPVPGNFAATLESWRALENLLYQGRVRAIGVCNFTQTHLEVLMGRTEIVPAVNQVELHPYFNQLDQRQTNTRLGIVTQSWSPLGGAYGYRPLEKPITPLLEHPVIAAIAKAHGKTTAQVIVRWHVQHGLSVIPKSSNPERIAANAAVFDFALSQQDMDAIDALDNGNRAGPDPDLFDLDYLKMLNARAGK